MIAVRLAKDKKNESIYEDKVVVHNTGQSDKKAARSIGKVSGRVKLPFTASVSAGKVPKGIPKGISRRIQFWDLFQGRTNSKLSRMMLHEIKSVQF